MTSQPFTREDEIESERQAILGQWLSDYELPDLTARFQNEIGRHEALDRSWMLGDHWMEYVLSHPVVAMDKDLFTAAYRAHELMLETYQAIERHIHGKETE